MVAKDPEEESVRLFTLSNKISQPIMVEVRVNDVNLLMEVNTGAPLSTISQKQKEQLFPSAPLHMSGVALRTYSSEQLTVVGEMSAHMHYGTQVQDLPLLVVEGDGPTLLGRNWLEKIHLNWMQIAYHSASNLGPSLEEVQSKY